MDLINKMKIGNIDYDLQDRLMPDALGTAGEVLKVKDDGTGLEFGNVGAKLYRHSIVCSIPQSKINAYDVSNEKTTVYSTGNIFLEMIYGTSTPFTKKELCSILANTYRSACFYSAGPQEGEYKGSLAVYGLSAFTMIKAYGAVTSAAGGLIAIEVIDCEEISDIVTEI